MTSLPTTRTSCVSRVADVRHRHGGTIELPERVQGAGGVRLLLSDADPPISSQLFWSDYQVHRAVLEVPGRRPRQIPVEVELAPWSSGRREVSLRFSRPLRPEVKSRQFDAALRAVEALVRELEAPAPVRRSDDLALSR